MSEHQATGKTTIAPEVLVTIARLTALNVVGVSRLSPVPGDIGPLLRRDAPEGVRIVVDGKRKEKKKDLMRDVNVREVSRNIQGQVTLAISEIVGMEVGRVNVHVEDMDYSRAVA